MANAKPRVHEIASELGVDSKVALAKLKELGEFVKSPSSTIEPPWLANFVLPSRQTAPVLPPRPPLTASPSPLRRARRVVPALRAPPQRLRLPLRLPQPSRLRRPPPRPPPRRLPQRLPSRLRLRRHPLLRPPPLLPPLLHPTQPPRRQPERLVR